jgi:hypothetical protein
MIVIFLLVVYGLPLLICTGCAFYSSVKLSQSFRAARHWTAKAIYALLLAASAMSAATVIYSWAEGLPVCDWTGACI